MIYAVRCDVVNGTIDLWCSEGGRRVPSGYEACDEATFHAVWRERDRAAHWRQRELIALRQMNRRGIYEAA